VVAQPWRRAEELVTLWLCVAPLRLGGLRGKKSTPSVWLGGTGEFVAVGKQEQERLEHRNHCCKQIRPRYVPETSRVECTVIYCFDYGYIITWEGVKVHSMTVK
jgi:hypothetical protein